MLAKRARSDNPATMQSGVPAWIIISVTTLYVALLFVLATNRDQGAPRDGGRWQPVIYALALGVYCTSWTFFGAVGTAAEAGWEYLPIYLGPAMVFLLALPVIQRIAEIAKRESITSLSDFLSARYGKSRAVAALATSAAVLGSLPYISLQLKSVGMSFQALSSNTRGELDEPAVLTVLVTAIALAAFAVLFGTRHTDQTRHNHGLIFVIAFESLFKLIALIAVAVLAMILIVQAPTSQIAPLFGQTFSPETASSGRVITILLLSMGAIICLPRQFHVAIIEFVDRRDLKTARLIFPVYLALTAIVVIPITLAGQALIGTAAPADLYVLGLPLATDQYLLAIIVFLGGFAAATGMVIMSTIALSSMVTNDLIVPFLIRRMSRAATPRPQAARLQMIRRAVIVVMMLLAYGYYRLGGDSAALAATGLLSFAAVAQFLPALIGALFWRRAHRNGVIAGLCAGMVLWAYTLLMPVIDPVGAWVSGFPAALTPQGLFGMTFGDPLTHGVVWSLVANVALFVAVSLLAGERLRDRVQANAFMKTARPINTDQDAILGRLVSPEGLKTLVARFLPPEAVAQEFAAFSRETQLNSHGDARADLRLVQRAERMLAGAIGASSARVVIGSAMEGGGASFDDVLSILDQQTRAAQFDRHLLQSMLENIAQGIAIVDGQQRLVAWNSAYAERFNYPSSLLKVSQPIETLIAHNVERGWIEGVKSEAVEKRLQHMKAGLTYRHERETPDGRWVRLQGNPIPGGGYITTFTDITEDKRREQVLLELNETLEQRVADRTAALKQLTEELDGARGDAVSANASKTRFLAAASHDLLQPLNAARLLLGAVDLSSEKGRLEARDHLVRVDRAIQSADQLLKGLLDISRLDHGNIAARNEAVLLAPLFEELVLEATPMAKAAGVELRLVPTHLAVEADPDFLRSILRNYLSNARRYTRKGKVLMGVRRQGHTLRLDVIDQGPGIAEALQKQIFEEFQRGEDSDNIGMRGAGLGLSLVSRLAEIMSAPIELSSRPGHGSRFSITLPRTAACPARRPGMRGAQPQPMRISGNKRVLCLDDERLITDAMTALLERHGYEVTSCQSLAEARQSMLDTAPDIVIADYQLGTEGDGMQFLEWVHELEENRVRLALLTANHSPELLPRAAAIGAALLYKPAEPEAVLAFLASPARASIS
jgi:PAS domain S-box-containing protein